MWCVDMYESGVSNFGKLCNNAVRGHVEIIINDRMANVANIVEYS